MATTQTVFLAGGTGRTGQLVLQELLERGFRVRVVVRSRRKLPANAADHPHLEVIEADLLALSQQELQDALRECEAIISCLGHVISVRGIFGPPWGLVTTATARLCQAVEALSPAKPVRLVLMSSVSVHRPSALDAVRSTPEKALLWLLRALVPPARDNQLAADYLCDQLGSSHNHVQWCIVRPDTLLPGDVSPYTVHEGLVHSLSSPGNSTMANVAQFMCELITDPKRWAEWNGKLPVIVNETSHAG